MYFALRNAFALPRDSSAGETNSHEGLAGLEDVLRQDWLYPATRAW